ncbi:hypothetical protein [Maritimibacter dapengensis]|uniref:Uncharacterized protein n=1 Tax=Maritimibacter dapengensis TaxID=2836868 RepID=A0ABS6T2P6_9RHOB|nr:hypothetical protein [Maritimibacter dapengensis]MBV7379524.1 hypothetical protein [Maritimibacter dapengensis]
MKRFVTLLGLVLAVPAFGEAHNTPADLDISCNANGAVLVLGQNTIEPGATYYLGKDCDAYSPGKGSGRWWLAASAVVVEINGVAIRFANDIDCPALPGCFYAD